MSSVETSQRPFVCGAQWLLLSFWTLVFGGASPAIGDVLFLKDGRVVRGEIIRDSASRVSFKGLNGRTKKYDKSRIERMEITWSAPDLARTDPNWSGIMVQERINRDMNHVKDKTEVFRTKHYIIFTNSSAGSKYLATMEDVYKKFRKEFPFPENEANLLLPVFLFLTKQHYHEFCEKTLGMPISRARSTAGVASSDFYACHYSSPKDSINYHEGAHQLVHNRLRMPGGGSWFQEGLAVFYEMLVFPQARKIELVRSTITSERYTPLAELMQLRSLIFSSDSTKSSAIGQERYNQSGSVIHFMRRGSHRDKFDELVAAVKEYGYRRVNWRALILQVYGMPIEEFEKEWKSYILVLDT